MSLSILPVFSFSSFKSFRFAFRSLIHFALVFVYVVRKCSSFSLFLLGVQYGQHHLLKKLSFPHFNKLYKIIQSNISAQSQRATLLQRQLTFVPNTQILQGARKEPLNIKCLSPNLFQSPSLNPVCVQVSIHPPKQYLCIFQSNSLKNMVLKINISLNNMFCPLRLRPHQFL